MSVLFNHACRYELFDRNPIYLVRQSAKRRRAPTILIPTEIKVLVDNLSVRERTLVLLAVSTGLRQSELFGLKWGDIDFAERTMKVTRSIVYGVVGPCKTESSIAKAGTRSSAACRRSLRVAKRLRLHEVR
jgi:integrase